MNRRFNVPIGMNRPETETSIVIDSVCEPIPMVVETQSDAVETSDPVADPVFQSDVTRKLLFREQYDTRNVRILFSLLLAVGIIGTLVWIGQQGITGQPGIVMGLVVGYLAMGVFAVAVVAILVTLSLKTAYLAGDNLVGRLTP